MGIGGIIGGAADAARRAAEAAKRAAEAAAKKAAEAAAKKTAEAAATATKTTEQIASVAKKHTQDVFERHEAPGDSGRDVKQKDRETVGDFFEDLRTKAGDALKDTAQKVGEELGKATDVLANGLDQLGQAIQDAPAQNPVQDFAQDLAGGILQGAAGVVRDSAKTVGAAKDALNFNTQVEQLKPGESVSVGLNAEVDVYAVGITGKGDLTVSRSAEEGGGYTVSASGDVGAGIIGKMGGKGAADASASVFGTAGGTVEYKFDTLEEAQRAAGIIAANAAVSGASGQNPLLGLGLNFVLGDPRSELAGLRDNVSAVEFELGAEGNLAGELGMKGLQDVLGAGASAGVDINQSTTARIEMEGGKPTSLTLTQSQGISADVGANVGLGVPSQGKGGPSASLPTSASAGVEGSLKVELEQSIDLPGNFNLDDFLRDPKSAAQELGKSSEAKVTLTDSRQGSAQALGLGGSMGREVNVEISGNLEDIANSGAFTSIANGDVGQAVTQLGGKVDIKATVQDKTTVKGDIGVGVHAGVVGAEAGVTTERTTVGEEHELTAAQLVELYLTQRWSAGVAS
ncbi:hypothetical protein MXAN_0493 [Myxococcus xanthus DK 1622]|uniref:Late embryogenesis abundant protein n=1 Tax=Myxococcus xanthus (strain DK1622) TaxID=246197 RepID=Q1DF10_MYXXD|nr:MULTISPECIES: hypothetical protein [Myxococcus]ABF87620.1 hypothetical protein MXAN_0493 [Myxococcus xanthus DK 1622]NOJ58136.1 hypothetical protein [Myxococcus xanthus]QPM80197.1 hypothetical protein I5Q59_02540 [Myxococcus xanthus]QVW69261.1 hypothetical protein JTM82_06830 [Myxococcus xanthus DZ2]QZZ48040.1 hypothetical protein MyxoNM_02450 [Myxococcus xanthus]